MSIDSRKDKLWYIHSSKGQYYRAIEQSELLLTGRMDFNTPEFKFFVRIQTLGVYCIISLK